MSITEASVATAIRSSTLGGTSPVGSTTELQRRDGIDVEFRYLAIPDDWHPPVVGAFQAETMQSLSRLGRGSGMPGRGAPTSPRGQRAKSTDSFTRKRGVGEDGVEPP